jgi:regulation of enolase protein 1 (concanavalin A-like superfamily)
MRSLALHLKQGLAILCALWWFACAPQPIQHAGGSGSETIIGCVVDSLGVPARNAIVRLRNSDFYTPLPGLTKSSLVSTNTMTDSSGRFEMQNIDFGSYSLEITSASSAGLITFEITNSGIHDIGIDTLKPFGVVVGVADTQKSPGSLLFVQVSGLERLIRVDANGHYTLTDLPEGNYNLRIVAMQSGSAVLLHEERVRTVASDTVVLPSVLPGPWLQTSIGETSSGGAMYADALFTLAGSGSDIWGSADGFYFVYQPVVGNVQITAQISVAATADLFSKAGVMIRETLDTASPMAGTYLITNNDPRVPFVSQGIFRREKAIAATSPVESSFVNIPAHAPQVWIRITRTGNVFESFASPDPQSWQLVGRDTIPMSETAYLGFAISSHSTAHTTISHIDSVSIE